MAIAQKEDASKKDATLANEQAQAADGTRPAAAEPAKQDAKPKTNPFLIALITGGIVVIGTVVTIDLKIMYETEGTGLGDVKKAFAKPWFSAFAMFMGMSLSLFAYAAQCAWEAYQTAQQRTVADAQLRQGLLAADGTKEQAAKEERAPFFSLKTFAKAALPASCDLMATGLQAVGLVYVSASIYSIFRGANILMTAILSVFVLRKRLAMGQFLGLVLVLAGLVVVGIAANSDKADDAEAGNTNLPLGIAFIVAAQGSQAIQYVWEEFVTKGRAAKKGSDKPAEKPMQIPPFMLIGLEGVAGMLMFLCIIFPFTGLVMTCENLFWLKGEKLDSESLKSCPFQDHGHTYENFLDTLAMLRSSAALRLLTTIYIVTICGLNMCGIMCTKLLSGVIRALMQNGIRTLSIWVTDLALFYWFRGAFGSEHELGEPWTASSPGQALGFSIYVLGFMLYIQVLKVPILETSSK